MLFLKSGTMQTVHNLSVTGGAERVRYYVNVGFTMEDGIYKQDNLNAYKTMPIYRDTISFECGYRYY